MKRLDAWLEEDFVGRFVVDERGTSFHYAPHAPEGPISLSLPRDGSATRHAAERFLENLLPETRGARARLASAYGAASTDTVDLLEAAGGDVAGGLLLLPEGRSPTATTPQWHPALEEHRIGQ